jgi:hypothetical protein
MVRIATEEPEEYEPNNKPKCNCCPLDWAESDAEILEVDQDESREVEVAMDSGAVCNCTGPEDLPGNIEVKVPKNRKLRNLVGAGGEGIKCYGESEVTLEMEEEGFAPVNSTFQVTDVTRTLHSTGEVCDGKTRDEHEVLFTSDTCTVVPAGTLSKFLGTIKQLAKYHRPGKGLYTAKMRIRKQKPKDDRAKPAGFGRQGRKQ